MVLSNLAFSSNLTLKVVSRWRCFLIVYIISDENQRFVARNAHRQEIEIDLGNLRIFKSSFLGKLLIRERKDF